MSDGPTTYAGLVDPQASSGEPFRSLYLALRLRHEGKGGMVCVVTGAEPGCGKSTVSANLAMTAAASGIRTLLVDADIRRPVQHAIFGISRAPGVVDFLAVGGSLGSFVHRAHGVDVVPSGRNVDFKGDISSWPRLTEALDALSLTYDLIVLDTPPVLAAAEATAIAAYAESEVAFVVSPSSRRRDVTSALRKLDLIGARVAGIIMNREGQLISYGHGY